MSETWLEAKSLEIEYTESTIMRSPQKTISVLNELNAMGVTLAIDDFGTGYSSLSYLQKFPIDVLKIDRFFVKDVSKNNGGASIVNAIISMAHSLNMSVVAEGVEDNEQLAFLQEHDCEMVQGFLFSKPVPDETAMQLLKAGVIEVEKFRHASGS